MVFPVGDSAVGTAAVGAPAVGDKAFEPQEGAADGIVEGAGVGAVVSGVEGELPVG